MKIVVRVPINTIPYKCGERYMVCDYDGEIKKCLEFFKTWDDFCGSEISKDCVNLTKTMQVLAV